MNNKQARQLPENTLEYIEANSLDRLVPLEINQSQRTINQPVAAEFSNPIPPDWEDLVRLHQLIVQRRVTTILEFGVGHSTLIMADALQKNRANHGEFVGRNLRRNNPFELHSVDDVEKYIDHIRGRIPSDLSDLIELHHSPCRMGTFNGRVCSYYDKLPDICPDFVYLDGPNQFSPLGDIRGVSTRHSDRLPMSADILAIEHFLLPGTMIMVDGRTANARFLRANLQREWHYEHLSDRDVHSFEQIEQPLGKYNRAQMDFSGGGNSVGE